jgi:hypothetical protein
MIIFVDIDDTICYYEDDNIQKNYNNAKPYHERIKKINNLYNDGSTIIYWTARGTLTGINWFEITYNQLKSWGCLFHELRMGKPSYDLFIDDKNINSDDFFKLPT